MANDHSINVDAAVAHDGVEQVSELVVVKMIIVTSWRIMVRIQR